MTKFIMDLETTGLNPFESEIIAIGIVDETGDHFIWDRARDEKEEVIIERFIDWAKRKLPVLIGYNIRSFDLKFIQIRAWKHGLDPKIFDILEVIDLIQYLHAKHTYASLDFWCEFLGIPIKCELNGKDMGAMWEKKDYESIKAHLEDDLFKTMRVWERVK